MRRRGSKPETFSPVRTPPEAARPARGGDFPRPYNYIITTFTLLNLDDKNAIPRKDENLKLENWGEAMQ